MATRAAINREMRFDRAGVSRAGAGSFSRRRITRAVGSLEANARPERRPSASPFDCFTPTCPPIAPDCPLELPALPALGAPQGKIRVLRAPRARLKRLNRLMACCHPAVRGE
jgi:hypothetical protein